MPFHPVASLCLHPIFAYFCQTAYDLTEAFQILTAALFSRRN